MADIDYFFATLSPWSYLAGTRLEQIAARHGVTVAYKPIDLLSVFARTGGVPPKDRHPSRNEYRAQELLRQSAKLKMPFNLKPQYWPPNIAPSAYAIISAANSGTGDVGPLVHAFLRACWAEEKDIADPDVIRSVLADCGFDPDLADKGMLTAAETYAANTEEAVSRGVFGAPFYIVNADDQRFWGQDRLDDLDAYLGAKRK